MTIKNLNIRAMESLIAMVENNYSPYKASLDLKCDSAEISKQMIRIEDSFNFNFFVRGKRKNTNKLDYILGLTEKGNIFYLMVRKFMTEVLINSEQLER